MSLYFAYGSNLNADDLANWCIEKGHDPVDLNLVTPAWLPDHRLTFPFRSSGRDGGVLDIAEAGGCAVPGALFKPDADGWRILDMKEGAPDWYSRVGKTVLAEGHREVSAVTYAVNANRRVGHFRPGEKYLAAVRDGLSGLGQPTSHLEAASTNRVEYSPSTLFVYGTLRARGSRHAALGALGAHYLGERTVRGVLYDCGAYPGMVDGDGEVVGELYQFEDVASALVELDQIEGFTGYATQESLFRRVITIADAAPAWTYHLTRPEGLRRIPSVTL